MNQIKYVSNLEKMSIIPGCPFAYWASDNLLSTFNNPKLGEVAPTKKGLDTGDNDRFLRYWFEINIKKFGFNCTREEFSKIKYKWCPHDKGGEYRKWFGNNTHIINWENNGYELKHSKANIRSEHLYFRKSITWCALTSGNMSFRSSIFNGTFDSAGSSLFPDKNEEYLLSFLNSKVAQTLISYINPTLNYGAGSVGLIPIIFQENKNKEIINLSTECLLLSKKDWNSFETSWEFKKHPLI